MNCSNLKKLFCLAVFLPLTVLAWESEKEDQGSNFSQVYRDALSSSSSSASSVSSGPSRTGVYYLPGSAMDILIRSSSNNTNNNNFNEPKESKVRNFKFGRFWFLNPNANKHHYALLACPDGMLKRIEREGHRVFRVTNISSLDGGYRGVFGRGMLSVLPFPGEIIGSYQMDRFYQTCQEVHSPRMGIVKRAVNTAIRLPHRFATSVVQGLQSLKDEAVSSIFNMCSH